MKAKKLLRKRKKIAKKLAKFSKKIKKLQTKKAKFETKLKKLSYTKVIAHCKEFLTNYKVPKEVFFTDELTKTNVGKILSRKIK